MCLTLENFSFCAVGRTPCAPVLVAVATTRLCHGQNSLHTALVALEYGCYMTPVESSFREFWPRLLLPEFMQPRAQRLGDADFKKSDSSPRLTSTPDIKARSAILAVQRGVQSQFR